MCGLTSKRKSARNRLCLACVPTSDNALFFHHPLTTRFTMGLAERIRLRTTPGRPYHWAHRKALRRQTIKRESGAALHEATPCLTSRRQPIVAGVPVTRAAGVPVQTIAEYTGTSANSRRRVQTTTLEQHNIVDTIQHATPWWLNGRYAPYLCTRRTGAPPATCANP